MPDELKDQNNNMGSNDYLGSDRQETKLAAQVSIRILSNSVYILIFMFLVCG